MFFLSKTHSGQRTGSRALVRKPIWLRILVLAGLGAMVLTVWCFLPGCGSDNTPGGTVKGKNAKIAAVPKATKMQAAIPLLLDKEGTNSVKMGQIKHQPEYKSIEVLPGITEEEIEGGMAADRKIAESPDTEVLPGITQGELEARMAANKASFDPKTEEVFPGITQAQLETQNAKQALPDKRELLPPELRN